MDLRTSRSEVGVAFRDMLYKRELGFSKKPGENSLHFQSQPL